MKTELTHLPSGAKIDNLNSKNQVIDFINSQKEKGYESNCIYHLNGDITINLSLQKEGSKTRSYVGYFHKNK